MKMKKSNICQNTYFKREAKSMRCCISKTYDGVFPQQRKSSIVIP